MNYTTIEQSKKLLELGLNPETADMWWTPLNWQLTEYYVEVKQDGIGTPKNPIPCWSLGALLEMMPTSIEEVKDHKVDLILGHPKDKWCLAYFDWTGLQQGHSTTGDTPLEAAYNMVVWLLENGYLNKE